MVCLYAPTLRVNRFLNSIPVTSNAPQVGRKRKLSLDTIADDEGSSSKRTKAESDSAPPPVVSDADTSAAAEPSTTEVETQPVKDVTSGVEHVELASEDVPLPEQDDAEVEALQRTPGPNEDGPSDAPKDVSDAENDDSVEVPVSKPVSKASKKSTKPASKASRKPASKAAKAEPTLKPQAIASPRIQGPPAPPPPPSGQPRNPLEDAELLDTVLVASVDGKFHALNRSTGDIIWSMASFTPDHTSVPSTLSPLVRTQHPPVDPDLVHDSDPHETYIIEPQTGDIYVSTSPSLPLQRFPYSMAQLADLGGVSFDSTGNGDNGLVELETGRIKATIDPQCPWDQFQDLHDDDVDLEELESDEVPKKTTENLSFSTYGPNNQDMHLQAGYRQTKDSSYIQGLPDGNIISFNSRPSKDPRRPHDWMNSFPNPIVVVFDSAFVLLQPRRRLEDIMPKEDRLPSTQNAFVGMVKESGSLYAMSAVQYPMVAFPEARLPSNENGPGYLSHYEDKLMDICQTREGLLTDLRCQVGIKPVDIGSRQSSIPPPFDPPSPVIGTGSDVPTNKSYPTNIDRPEPAPEEVQSNWRTTFASIAVAFLGIGFFLARASTRHSTDTLKVDNPLLSNSTPVALNGHAISPPSLDLPTSDSPPDIEPPLRTIRRTFRNAKEDSPASIAGAGGKGKKKEKEGSNQDDLDSAVDAPGTPRSAISFESPPVSTPKPTSLIVSEKNILGYGSHGTVVYKGSLQGRPVAVKRLLQDFVTLASREVAILQESDYHPNVIRYYYQEAHADFLYIALELCPCSLADVIENPDREDWRDIAISFEPKKALQQITAGLRHLHGLKLQNILVSSVKSIRDKPTHRMLISDFGLSMAAGTVGWRAPEILRGEVKIDDLSDENSMSSRGSVGTASGGSTGSGFSGTPTRLTKSIDIFALGCLFYYTMTNGGHPFGERFEREMNILKNCQVVSCMLSPESSARPDTATCLLHPFFWDSGRRLNFFLNTLEENAIDVVGNDWRSRLDKTFLENLGKFRKYDGASVQDLLRALRNKKNHYQDLPDYVKRNMGPLPEGFLSYFTRRYPRLFLHVHSVVQNTPLRTDARFRSYFDLAD
ncbi:hypothetical protein DL96DRAFT_1668744 [Flagelloscypha sp. PMI_526]|nr:hypothetical protein DL96DRAFT_1668744 [Flagelloscypha sp. PMI_526]